MRKLPSTHRMMGVIGRQSIENINDFVGLVVSIGVLQMNDPWFVHHQHATVVKFESGGANQLVIKCRAFVGFAIAIGVFQNQQTVTRS